MMESQGKIVIMVLITITMGHAKEDSDIMKEMMAEMKMEMEERLSVAEGKVAELESKVAILRDPPFLHACGANDDVLNLPADEIITYNTLLYSATNTEGGGLDISTGVFTAPHGGSYTVYWDTSAWMDQGEYVNIFVQKNGESIQETAHYSYYGGNDRVSDQGNIKISKNSNCILHCRWPYCCRISRDGRYTPTTTLQEWR